MKYIILSLLLIFSISFGCTSFKLIRHGDLNVGKVEELRNGIQNIRGLDFKESVDIALIDKNELQSIIIKKIEEEYQGNELEVIEEVYRFLGLWPEELDLKETILSLLTDQVAGFYDEKSKKMYLVNETLNLGLSIRLFEILLQKDLTGEIAMTHELVHALQDQYYNLDEFLDIKDNDDVALARKCLVEGDASLASINYSLPQLKADKLVDSMDKISGSQKAFTGIPDILVEELLFEYTGGLNFASDIFTEGGWERVNKAYINPPASTEQILHPEKYLGNIDLPISIELPNIDGDLLQGHKLIYNNVIGEFYISILLKEFLKDDEAKIGSEGWDGDTINMYEKDGDLFMIWMTVWDTENDAEEFFQIYSRLLEEKYKDNEFEKMEYAQEIKIKKGNKISYIGKDNTNVLILEGIEESQLESMKNLIWRETRFNTN